MSLFPHNQHYKASTDSISNKLADISQLHLVDENRVKTVLASNKQNFTQDCKFRLPAPAT